MEGLRAFREHRAEVILQASVRSGPAASQARTAPKAAAAPLQGGPAAAAVLIRRCRRRRCGEPAAATARMQTRASRRARLLLVTMAAAAAASTPLRGGAAAESAAGRCGIPPQRPMATAQTAAALGRRICCRPRRLAAAPLQWTASAGRRQWRSTHSLSHWIRDNYRCCPPRLHQARPLHRFLRQSRQSRPTSGWSGRCRQGSPAAGFTAAALAPAQTGSRQTPTWRQTGRRQTALWHPSADASAGARV